MLRAATDITWLITIRMRSGAYLVMVKYFLTMLDPIVHARIAGKLGRISLSDIVNQTTPDQLGTEEVFSLLHNLVEGDNATMNVQPPYGRYRNLLMVPKIKFSRTR
jgi:hypothetical protein